MKVKTDLLLNLRACALFLRETSKKSMVNVQCHYCKSPYIKFSDGFEKGDSYISRYECTNCGARATNVEKWTRGEAE